MLGACCTVAIVDVEQRYRQGGMNCRSSGVVVHLLRQIALAGGLSLADDFVGSGPCRGNSTHPNELMMTQFSSRYATTGGLTFTIELEMQDITNFFPFRVSTVTLL